MAQTFRGKRVKHSRTGREGTCRGPSKTHRDWYNILWDGEQECYRYERSEFRVQEDTAPKD